MNVFGQFEETVVLYSERTHTDRKNMQNKHLARFQSQEQIYFIYKFLYIEQKYKKNVRKNVSENT